MKKIAAAVALMVCAGAALAGGHSLDANGCYTTKAGVTKCKTMKASHFDKRLPGGETQTQRDKRLTRECRGAANGGACLGYARPY